MKGRVFFDLDNCISDDQWRLVHWLNRRYETYQRLSYLDDPHVSNCMVLGEMARQGAEIYICTARPERYRNHTLTWLDHVRISSFVTAVLMREDSDASPSAEVKRRFVRMLRPVYAFDDRLDILRMYEEERVPHERMIINAREDEV